MNRRFAEKYWPGENAIGKRLRVFPIRQSVREEPWLTVVGLVPDIRQLGTHRPDIDPLIYVPFKQEPKTTGAFLLARATGDGHSLTASLRNAVWKTNQDVSVQDIMTLNEYFGRTRWQTSFFGTLFVIFALIGLVLAMVGTYATMAYSVSQRDRKSVV